MRTSNLSNKELTVRLAAVDPALEQFRAGLPVTAKHPDTGETLVVTESHELGFVHVSTPSLGVFFRMRLSKDRGM